MEPDGVSTACAAVVTRHQHSSFLRVRIHRTRNYPTPCCAYMQDTTSMYAQR